MMVSMPVWALGSFLRVQRRPRMADLAGLNARVGFGVFSTLR